MKTLRNDDSAAGPVTFGEIHRADPRSKRRVLFAVLIFGLLGTWAVVDLRNQVDAAQQLSHLSVRLSAEAMVAAADGFFRMVALWIAALGIYLCWSASRIFHAGRFPPPGALLIRDTRVQSGAAARFRGGLALAMGILSLASALAIPLVGGERVRQMLAVPLATPDEPPAVIDPDVIPGSGAPGAAPVLPSDGVSADPLSP
ncbi:MAG: hypothetical protein MI919_02290 [Holophagales bacterium]|nr:hypothetical protein [Holophagales bacterium]